MPIAYIYDNKSYYLSKLEDYNIKPISSTYVKPEIVDGYIPKWNGKEWEQVENHKGLFGYIDGMPVVIKEYGPLPEGFTTEILDNIDDNCDDCKKSKNIQQNA